MNVKEILHRDPPTTLYHYTTQNGLLGIVTDKEIWASHTQYLNDVREFRHAIEIVKEELSRMMKEPRYQDNAELLSEMKQGVREGLEGINVCVCSFSEDGDLMSQWRAYAGGASGFSIGFSGAFLQAVSDQLKFWLVPVLYREEDQRELIRTLLEDVLTENVQRLANPKDPDNQFVPLGGNLLAYLNRYAPILKHKAFSEEREWRIISRPLFSSRDGFGYREGASMLIPYFRIPLSSEQQPFRIEEIIVGPTPHPEQSIRSVKGLLISQGLENPSVRNSEAPYRSW